MNDPLWKTQLQFSAESSKSNTQIGENSKKLKCLLKSFPMRDCPPLPKSSVCKSKIWWVKYFLKETDSHSSVSILQSNPKPQVWQKANNFLKFNLRSAFASFSLDLIKSIFTCSKSLMETPEQCVRCVQS